MTISEKYHHRLNHCTRIRGLSDSLKASFKALVNVSAARGFHALNVEFGGLETLFNGQKISEGNCGVFKFPQETKEKILNFGPRTLTDRPGARNL